MEGISTRDLPQWYKAEEGLTKLELKTLAGAIKEQDEKHFAVTVVTPQVEYEEDGGTD